MIDIKLLATGVCLFYWLANQVTYKMHYRKEMQDRAKKRAVYETSSATKTFKIAVKFLYVLVLIRIIATPFLELALERSNLILGSILCSFGILLLSQSLKALGTNYAPCHAGILPNERVKDGPYKVFGHPIYIANLVLIAGIWIVLGGFLLGLVWVIFAVFYGVSIRDEERALQKHFSAQD